MKTWRRPGSWTLVVLLVLLTVGSFWPNPLAADPPSDRDSVGEGSPGTAGSLPEDVPGTDGMALVSAETSIPLPGGSVTSFAGTPGEGAPSGEPDPSAARSSVEPQAAVIVASFEGIHQGVNGNYSVMVSPPDVPLAAGPTHVLELVNGLGSIWTKDGNQVQIFKIQTLFQVPAGDGVGDPRVLYDALSGRWFASAADFTTGSVLLAVSTSSDPTGAWNAYGFSAGGPCPDQPLLGLSDDKVVLTSNVFETSLCTGAFLGGQYWVVNKADVLAGVAPRTSSVGPDTAYYSMFPAQPLSPTTTQFVLQAATRSMLRLHTLTGVPPGSVTLASTDLSIATMGSGVDAVQPGTSFLLETGDTRVRDAFWKEGHLWAGMNDGCRPTGDSADRSCVRLTEVDTTTRTILQEFDVGAANTYYFYPAARLDSGGNLLVTFGFSSSSDYPGVAATYRSPADPLNTLRTPITVRSGAGTISSSNGSCNGANVCRYGDYSGAGVDPSEPTTVWTAVEYGAASGWATYIAAISASASSTVTLTMSYSVRGGGSGYQSPTLMYAFNGTTLTTDLTLSPTAYVVDRDSAWSVTNPLAGSGPGERWRTNQAAGGTAARSTTVAFVYDHQYEVTFDFQVVGGGIGHSPPSIGYTQYGVSATTPAASAVWADAGTGYTYPVSLPGSSSSEAWRTTTPNGIVSQSGTLTVSFTHQYRLSFVVLYQGGGSPSPVPLLRVPQFALTIAISPGNSDWADASGTYAFPTVISGSSASERWISPASGTGSVNASLTLTATYYRQYFVTFAYTVLGGGSGYSPPTITFLNASGSSATPVDAFVWADVGSAYQYQDPLPGSTSTESWRTRDGTGSIGHEGPYSSTYRHQFRMRFKATSTSGSPTTQAPLINVTTFGTIVAAPADSIDWVDAGGTYQFPAVFYGPLAGERWLSEFPASGTITGSAEITVAYVHQYYLMIQVNAAEGGTVTGIAGWYNETLNLTLQASAAPGWRFEGWIGSGNGSYSGPSTQAAITLNGPVTETVVFYVGLTLEASAGGSLAYSYMGSSGWIPSQSSQTIFVPPGTPLTVQAVPSLFYEFRGWRGSSIADDPQVTLALGAPNSLSAEFGISLYSKVDSVLGVVIASVILVTVWVAAGRRRRMRRQAFDDMEDAGHGIR